MKASIVDLRYRMKDILHALERKEMVQVLHYGKLKGTIIPAKTSLKKKSASEHEFFGCLKEDKGSVEKEIRKLRRVRYHDL
jgi:hypothetical protein